MIAFEFPVPPAPAVPLDAAVLILHVMVFPSTSVAFKVRLKAVGEPSSDMVTEVDAPSVIAGASLTGVTVNVNHEATARLPSLTSTVISADPF